MTYLLIYLLIGALSFLPMLYLDKECSQQVGGHLGWLATAWIIWTFVWAFSLALDALFWVIEKRDDKHL